MLAMQLLDIKCCIMLRRWQTGFARLVMAVQTVAENRTRNMRATQGTFVEGSCYTVMCIICCVSSRISGLCMTVAVCRTRGLVRGGAREKARR